MSAIYKIFLFDTDGIKKHEITEFYELQYVKERRKAGDCSFTFNGKSTKIADIIQDGQIEIWRKNASVGMDWYCDYYGVIRGFEHRIDDGGVEYYTVYAPGILDYLADRIIAYREDVDLRSAFGILNAEATLHTLVRYNATSDATTANGRLRNGVVLPVTITATTNNNNGADVVKYKCHERELLKTLEDVARLTDVSYTLVKTGTKTFDWKYIDINTTGYDKREDVSFSMERGNVRRITYTFDRRNERTVAIIGGNTEDDVKAYATRISYRKDNNVNDDREMFISAGNAEDGDDLNREGDTELFNQLVEPTLEFEIIQSPGTYYGKHYNLDDFVRARFKNIEKDFVIERVSVRVSEDKQESIEVYLEAKRFEYLSI